MTWWRDILSGYRARPAAALALASVGCAVGLFSAVGARVWSEADQESKRLLNAWPEDRTTLMLPTSAGPDDVTYLLNQLPEGSWWAWRHSEDYLQVKGVLPPELNPVEGTPLQPDLIRAGHPAALVDTSTSWSTGDIQTRNGMGFKVIGRTALPDSAKVLLPADMQSHPPFIPEKVEVRLPLNDLTPFIRDLPFFTELSLVDHQQKRSEAREGFRRLGLQLTLLGCGAAFLTALILRSLIRMELQERRFEFALRRSLGAQPSDIRRQIVAEIFFTAGVPALMGVLLVFPSGSHVGWLLTITVPGWFVLCALPPAFHAASLPPHEALKEG